jgi:formylglycine-generating enzyme required for sulfatase activity/serine/threonine protein kinase
MVALVCPGCQRRLRLPETPSGRTLRCPDCAHVLSPIVPSAEAAPPSAPASPPGPLAGWRQGTTDTAAGAAPAAGPKLTFLAGPQSPDELGRLGGFRVLRLLGEGGMGLVLEAEDPGLKRRVALKVMRPEVATHPQARERFLREARATAALTHDHVITIHQVGEDNGVPFLAMSLLKGETLEARLQREGRLPIPEVVRIGREIAEGLVAAHAAGLVHRDVKPANVWLEAPKGRVKLLDFGLARAQTTTDRLTRTHVVLGTPAYLAPEQASGKAEPGSDLFSLGVVLFEMAAGRRPFDGPDLMALVVQMATQEPLPLKKVRPEVPARLSDLVKRLLAGKPVQRPASAQVVSQELAALEGPAISTPPAPSPLSVSRTAEAPRSRPSVGRKRGWSGVAVAGTLLVLLGLAAATVFVVRHEQKRRVARLAQDGQDGPASEPQHPPLKDDAARDGDRDPAEEEQRQRQAEYERLMAEGRAALARKRFADAEKAFRGAGRQKPGDDAARKGVDEALAALAAPDLLIENSIGMRLKLIPAGRFLMGSPDDEKGRSSDEGPQRQVEISRPFYLGIHTVTIGQFRRFCDEAPYQTEAEKDGQGGWGLTEEGEFEGRKPKYNWKNPGWMQTDEYPVVNVTWNDAVTFCAWLSQKEKREYRLPTEAEWEYACRAGTSTPFWWGNSASSGQANFDGNHPYGRAAKGAYLKRAVKVGCYPANPWGLFDMHGNVWQWCNDWYDKDYYGQKINKDPQGPIGGSACVLRGGSWGNLGGVCRAACRVNYEPSNRSNDVGFRVALSIAPRTP